MGGGGGDFGVELGSLLVDLLQLRFRLGSPLLRGVEGLKLSLDGLDEGGRVVVGLEACLRERGLDVSCEGLGFLLSRFGLLELALQALGLRPSLLPHEPTRSPMSQPRSAEHTASSVTPS